MTFEGGAMPTILRTLGWKAWTALFVLKALAVVVYLAY
jgi:hypothetical protein